jgi:DNA ligase (NAD+)
MFSLAESAKMILSGEIEDPSEDTLVEILTAASDEYANEGDSFLEDSEYDALERMLTALNPKNLFLAQVGSDVRGGKIPLPYPMGSLDQVYEGETIQWVRANGWEDEDFVLTDKQDGTSALTVFSKGKLAIAYSRGNGFEGADITRHICRIAECPQSTNGGPQNIAVRAEVIIEDDVFASQKAQAEAEGGRVYKNARNYVAGRMNASASPQIFYDTVHVIGTSVVDPKMGKLEQLQTMQRMGFKITHYIVKKGRELTDEFLIPYLEERRRLSATAIDGIVIDIDNADIRAGLRRKSSSINPMYSRKFKVGGEDNVAVTTVAAVHWEPSKTGYLKPRVEINPVDLVGVTITYATGFNAKFIRDNKIGPGAKIQITRSGDVIPFIQKVLEPAPAGAALPTETEYGEMAWTEGEVDLFLKDADNHPTVQLNRMIDVFSALEVPFLRQGSLEKLFAEGYTTAAQVINASEADLKRVLGDSAGGKAYSGIRSKLNPVPLGILAGASQCMGRGIGRRKMTRLIEALGGPDVFLTNPPSVEIIAAVEGFERRTAETIVNNLPAFSAFLAEIAGHYTIAQPAAKVVGGALEGVTVVFTGVRDKDLEAAIAAKGGTIGSSVNKNTTHLVAKDPTGGSSKLKKAADMGVQVISLVEARELWG